MEEVINFDSLTFRTLWGSIYGPQASKLRKPGGQLYGVYTNHLTGGNISSNVERIRVNKGKVNFCNFWNQKYPIRIIRLGNICTVDRTDKKEETVDSC
jgi:hypothetical protein